jgi:hypothetical protein
MCGELPNLSDSVLHVCTDNTTALSYIRQMGGRVHEMGIVAEDLWNWCLERGVRLTASHVPGVLNVRADRWSRIPPTPAECCLSPHFFRLVCHRLCPGQTPSIDLFASRVTTLLPRYFSRYPDPGAVGVDAFLQPWSAEALTYAFPPFCLIGKVLRKLETEGGRMILIAPQWPSQEWWPLLLRLIVVKDPVPLT